MADHKYEKWIQKDNVVIEGIDVSGEWNKMYEPREIMDYDLTYMAVSYTHLTLPTIYSV